MLNQILTFKDCLRWRAGFEPDNVAYTILGDGQNESCRLTFGEFDRRVRAVSAELVDQKLCGEKVVLVYPPGEEFLVAFFACLYAGVIAIPVPPPRRTRVNTRLESIIADAGVSSALATRAMISGLQRSGDQVAELKRLSWIATDSIAFERADLWNDCDIEPDQLAFLQYTSGSTESPKGVMVTHRNLIENSRMIEETFGITEADSGCSWLPCHHDMGLIGGMLQTIYCGRPSVIMPPLAFLERPLRWLQAITKYRTTVSGGPNFAYEMCITRVRDDQLAELDLSSWRVAFSGAEPVRLDTLERFADKFAPCGFRPESFLPLYGLAEATLIVSGRRESVSAGPSDVSVAAGKQPRTTCFFADGYALSNHQLIAAPKDAPSARPIVGCGRGMRDQHIAIVDPETLRRLSDRQIGEVWVSGPSVARGYWNRRESTEQTFHALIHRSDEERTCAGPFLRTGDLGFLDQGELFITGRKKDLIIIRGRNYYPQDIEFTAERSHPAVAFGGAAACAIEAAGEEQVLLVVEVDRHANIEYGELFQALRCAVCEEHELKVHTILAVKPMRIPRTSSGKLKRFACREMFISGTVDGLLARSSTFSDGAWITSEAGSGPEVSPPVAICNEKVFSDSCGPRHHSTSRTNGHGEAKWVTCPPIPAAEIADRGNPLQKLEAVRCEAKDSAPQVIAASPELEMPRPRAGMREPLAIVGMGCRFPGAANIHQFRDMLRDGQDGIVETPSDRWSWNDYYSPNHEAPGKMVTRWGGFLPNVDKFDAAFFGLSPREVRRMDPQQRLLLEVFWETLENAGIPQEQLAGSRTGVFVGIGGTDYAILQVRNDERCQAIDGYNGTGNAHSIAANRISYLYDLRGPSLAIDTACSSSLVAVHMACQAIRCGDCDMAVAAGVNLILSPEVSVAFSKARMLSPEGRCKAFDVSADGYVRGEGCGVVLIKRLADAHRDGDEVLAVLRGTAVNQDGRTSSITVPSQSRQEEVIRAALADAGASPGDLGYIEAHGTGTPVGDPIEMNVLRTIVGDRDDLASDPSGLCFFGSVKANVGHLETASGMAGLIKVVLMLRHGEIYRQIHFSKLNPRVSLEGTALAISTENRSWVGRNGRRVAGINSFGFGGTNAHLVLEAAVDRTLEPASGGAIVSGSNHSAGIAPPELLTISAQTETALKAACDSYRQFLDVLPDEQVADFCEAARARRTHFNHRVAVVGRTVGEFSERLQGFLADETQAGITSGRLQGRERPKIAYLFTGQGGQFAGMGRGLYETQPVFREAIDRCDAILGDILEHRLLTVLYGDGGQPALVDQTIYTQPAMFALEYALAQLWSSWGVLPDAVMGHSLGEYVAACVARAVSVEDALRLVAVRAKLMNRVQSHGVMAAVSARESQVRAALENHAANHAGAVSIAAVNGPASVVISGEEGPVLEVLARLQAERVHAQFLNVSHAFHSPMMESILKEFGDEVSKARFAPPAIPLISNLTGAALAAASVPDAAYWCRHLRETVRFEQGMRTLDVMGCTIFLEIGPTPTLVNLGKKCIPASGKTWLTSLHKGQDDNETMLHTLGELYVRGAEVDWRAQRAKTKIRNVALPAYPFERERFWLDVGSPKESAASPPPRTCRGSHPLLGTRLRSALSAIQFESEIDLASLPYLGEHEVHGSAVLPAAAYLEMALAAAAQHFGGAGAMLQDCHFREALILPASGAWRLQVAIQQHQPSPDQPAPNPSTPDGAELWSFHIHGQPVAGNESVSAEWKLFASGNLVHGLTTKPLSRDEVPQGPDDRAGCGRLDLQAIRCRCRRQVSREALYSQLAAAGLKYGPTFQGVGRVSIGHREALGELDIPVPVAADAKVYRVHPAILDASLHVLAAALSGDIDLSQSSLLPVGLRRMTCYPAFCAVPGNHYQVHAVHRHKPGTSSETIEGDVRLCDAEGNSLLEIEGLSLRRLTRAGSAAAAGLDRLLYEVQWKPAEAPEMPACTGSPPAGQGNWLILADRHGVGRELARLLRDRGCHCVLVEQGEQTETCRAAEFSSELARSLSGGGCGAGPWHLVHLGSLDVDEECSLEKVVAMGCGTARRTMEQLFGRSPGENADAWLVTRGVHLINQEPGQISVNQSMLWGLGRTLQQLRPGLRTILVDLDSSATAEAMAAALFAEICAADRENQVAFRGGIRFVPRLCRSLPVPDGLPAGRVNGRSAGSRRLRADATYLIVADSENAALRVCDWLVYSGAKSVTVILPGDLSLHARQSIRELSAAGVEVRARAENLSDPSGWPRVLNSVSTARQALGGIVYAPGSGEPVGEETVEITAETRLAREACVAWNLHRALGKSAVGESGAEWLLFFSVASSVLGREGKSAPAATGALLEAIAREQQQLGRHAVAVHWGSWQGCSWRAEATSNGSPERGEGFLDFPADVAMQLAGELLEADGPPAVVATSEDWKSGALGSDSQQSRLWDELAAAEAVHDGATAGNSKSSAPTAGKLDLAQRLRSAGPQARREIMLSHFVDMLVRVTNQERHRIDCSRPLSRLGLDSLMAVELSGAIESALAVSLPLGVLLEDPCIDDLADRVLAMWAEIEGEPAVPAVDVQNDIPDGLQLLPL
jgi:acyl transferase domain-containing protein/acyl-CoA synthetase (AMP-forming)/AMP-acid ligase II/acyl carrier protein